MQAAGHHPSLGVTRTPRACAIPFVIVAFLWLGSYKPIQEACCCCKHSGIPIRRGPRWPETSVPNSSGIPRSRLICSRSRWTRQGFRARRMRDPSLNISAPSFGSQARFDRACGRAGCVLYATPPARAIPGLGLGLDRHHITTAELAVDSQIEHDLFSNATFQSSISFLTDQTCFGRNGGLGPINLRWFQLLREPYFNGVLYCQAWWYSSVCKNRKHARDRGRAAEESRQLSQACGHLRAATTYWVGRFGPNIGVNRTSLLYDYFERAHHLFEPS